MVINIWWLFILFLKATRIEGLSGTSDEKIQKI